MSYVKVYHNPHFLEYRGDHHDIVLAARPTASVAMAEGMNGEAMLTSAYERTQHGVRYASWFSDPIVIPHLRSTSVGDVLILPDGTTHVVEAVGFRPLQTRALRPAQRLFRACQALEAALEEGGSEGLRQAGRDSLVAMQLALMSLGYLRGDTPVLWEKAQVGDVVRGERGDCYRVLARRLRPKWRAQQLLEHIANGQMWRDGARTWAVVVPVSER